MNPSIKIVLGLVVLLLASVASAVAQGNEVVRSHVIEAREAAGAQHTALFNLLCRDVSELASASPLPMPPSEFPPIAGREEWYAEPARVFDNLYYVGQNAYSAWAITTSEGIIVLDAIFDYSVEQEIAEGLTSMGLDPSTIRYVVVSHAHRDHVGGARYLQERFGARVVMSEADWDLLENTDADWPKPVRDVVAVDGQQITLGETTMTLHITPGHTPGTISTIFPVVDGGERHVAASWGGTAFNFRGTAEIPREHWFQAYSESAARFRQLVTEAGADVLVANHPRFDNSTVKIPMLSERRSGDPHPFVIGTEGVASYLTVAEKCAAAALAEAEM